MLSVHTLEFVKKNRDYYYLVQLLVAVIDAQLLERINLEDLEPEDVEDLCVCGSQSRGLSQLHYTTCIAI